MNTSILKPALHTLWQSALAAIIVWWSASGLIGIQAVHNVSDAKRFAASAAIAVLAAVASAVLHAAKLYGPRLVGGLLSGKVNQAELALIMDALDQAVAPETATDPITAASTVGTAGTAPPAVTPTA